MALLDLIRLLSFVSTHQHFLLCSHSDRGELLAGGNQYHTQPTKHGVVVNPRVV